MQVWIDLLKQLMSTEIESVALTLFHICKPKQAQVASLSNFDRNVTKFATHITRKSIA